MTQCLYFFLMVAITAFSIIFTYLLRSLNKHGNNFLISATLFASIHNNDLAFGGNNIIVVGDLAQLPQYAVNLFSNPLFLTQPRRQQSDANFYQMLQEIRLGKISETTWDRLIQKAAAYKPCFSLESLVTTTHIVPYKQTAEQINRIVNNALLLENEKFAISEAIDFINGVQQNPETVLNSKQTCHYLYVSNKDLG